MDGWPEGAWLGALDEVVLVAWFRALPVCGAVWVSRGLGRGVKLALGLAVLGTALHLGRETTLLWLAAAYGYFAAAASALPVVARALRAGSLTRDAFFAGCVLVFFILPALVLPPSARAAVLILGWDFMLSSYSWGVENARGEGRLDRASSLFFVLVNPALVYTERGERVGPPAPNGAGLARIALGLASLLLASAVLSPACAAARAHAFGAPPWLEPVLGVAAFGALRFLLEYARQSGLASLQIGMLRQLGYAVPERYRWPIAARDPLDFWRRWNTYVGGFMRRYVFRPLALASGGRRWPAGIVAAASALATFAAVGVLHDAYLYAVGAGRDFRGLVAFSAIGALVVGWLACARAVRRGRHRDGRASSSVLRASATRALFWVLAVGCAAWGFDLQ